MCPYPVSVSVPQRHASWNHVVNSGVLNVHYLFILLILLVVDWPHLGFHPLQAIEKVKTDKSDKPYQDVKILNVTVPKL